MKKILKTNWERYKNSEEGKNVIAQFNRLTSLECTAEEMYAVIKRFNPLFARNSTDKEDANNIEAIAYYDKVVKDTLPENEEEWSTIDHGDFFAWITHCMAVEDEKVGLLDAPQIGFKRILGCNVFLSMALSKYMPEFFIPNLLVMQFVYFKKFIDKYELEIPEMPLRSDYRGRWLYYIHMCNAIVSFSVENDLQDFGELCAFLFDYELTNIKEEMEAEHSKPMPKVPEQAWILVGNYGDGEKNMKEGVWQANQLTSKGDIMLFYEKSPVKKLNAVWTALEDGFIDPFGPYYSYSIIGKKIEIPEGKAITYNDFKNSEYFKVENRGREGNFVSKNFQDVSGWAVTSSDYKEIKRMLEDKGFDTSILPSLYEPKKLAGVNIELEADVSNKLLVPLLEEMGWKRDVDFKAEVEFPAGRGTTGHQMEKRPDFCLHLTGKEKDLGAKVVIEVKLWMKNNEEIEANYYQGLSYAKWGNAQVLVLCDKNQIRVYERNKKGEFDENKWEKFLWEEMENLEKRNELKRMLNI